MSGLNLAVQWRTATVQKNGDAYNFPARFTPYFRQTYSIPAVYRWRVLRVSGEEREPVYIGEAEDLVRRMQRVLTPAAAAKPRDTNKRLHEIFRKYASEKRFVVIDVADVEPFEVNGVRFDQQGIGDRFKRRALENLMLVLAQASTQFQVLNTFVEPVDKAREALLRFLKPHQVREVLKHYGLDGSRRSEMRGK